MGENALGMPQVLKNFSRTTREVPPLTLTNLYLEYSEIKIRKCFP